MGSRSMNTSLTFAPLRALTRLAFAGALAVFLSGFGSGERLFAPSADLWERWAEHNPSSGASIDHEPWNAFLARYLVVDPDGANLVQYGLVSAEGRQALADYIDSLAAQPISTFGRDEQKAYWINLYNALTVLVVLNHYPVDSIRDIDISPGLFSSGPWGKGLVTIEGEDLSLNDIEHRILRPVWQDPRIHYAVNCASIGCPDLRPRAYTAANIEAVLEAAARAYVNDPRGVTVEEGRVTVSKIYDWFIEDFGHTPESVMAHIREYAEPDLKAALLAFDAPDDVAYDWSLNAAPAPRS
jgi:hypothetical protein